MELENRANQAIRKNDVVQIISGKEAGKSGKVLEVFNKKHRVIVESVNMVKKHQKPNQQNRQGGIIEKEAAIHLSNVMLVCSKCKRPVRVRSKEVAGQGRQRACVKCGEVIERKI